MSASSTLVDLIAKFFRYGSREYLPRPHDRPPTSDVVPPNLIPPALRRLGPWRWTMRYNTCRNSRGLVLVLRVRKPSMYWPTYPPKPQAFIAGAVLGRRR